MGGAALRGDTDVVESLTVDRPSSWRALQSELLSKRLFLGAGRWHEEIPPDQWREVAPLTAGQGSYLSRLPDYIVELIQLGSLSGIDADWRTYMWQDGSMKSATS